MKRGSLTWDTIGKLVLAVAFLLIMLYLIFLSKDKLFELGETIKDALAFR